MAKVAQTIYFDIADFQTLEEIRSMCKHKSLSQTLNFILKRYKKLCDEQVLLREKVFAAQKSEKKPVNPMVNP